MYCLTQASIKSFSTMSKAFRIYSCEQHCISFKIYLVIKCFAKDTPWKNGVWAIKNKPYALIYVKGSKFEQKNHVCLEYPDIEPDIIGSWNYGNFGTAHFDIFRSTGIEDYNVEQDLGFVKLQG